MIAPHDSTMPQSAITVEHRTEISAIRTCYRRYSRLYDIIFEAPFRPGRKAGVKALQLSAGDHILEVGIGTGRSLSLYPDSVDVTGVDVCPEMLVQARRHAKRLGRLPNKLHEMDARALSFADNAFDKTVAMYVASVTPDLEAVVEEMKRVTKNGGALCFVNHFSRQGSLMLPVERFLERFAHSLGFSPLYFLESFLKRANLEEVAVHPVRPFGYWYTVTTINRK